MKNYSLFWLLLIALTGCGQIGPLYLPNGPAPIYVPKEQPEPKATTTTTPTTPSAPEKTK
jgi:predicted small lipoprotein YifL